MIYSFYTGFVFFVNRDCLVSKVNITVWLSKESKTNDLNQCMGCLFVNVFMVFLLFITVSS